MSVRMRANVTDGQQVIARILLDEAGPEGWVDNAVLLKRAGICQAALSTSMNRRIKWGWVERRTLPLRGGPVQWRATESGRIRLRDVLIDGGAR